MASKAAATDTSASSFAHGGFLIVAAACQTHFTPTSQPAPETSEPGLSCSANFAPHRTAIRNSSIKVAKHLTGLAGELGHCAFSYKASCYVNISFGLAVTMRKINNNFTFN